jgi:purine-binding chemotaxis protein CheW
MRVHATVPDPALRPSVLAQGHCRGVMGYGGRDVPAVDLLAACGLGQLPLDGPLQAVLVQAGGGLVAFLVEQVIDVVRVDAAAVVPVPALALAQPGCVAGALPLSALSPELVARLGDGAPQFLVLSAQALQDDEHMAGLGSTCSGERQAAGAARLGSRRAPQRRMLTYELDGEGGGEAATPIEQIVEILAFESEASVLAGGDALLGLQLHRGHAIPVMCLSQLQGRAPRPTAPGTRVLVVDCAHGRLGFAVPRLRSIEAAEWSDAAASGEPATGTRSLARVDDGGSSRMVRVLDLQHLAARLSASRAAQVLAPAEPAALAAA